MTDLHYQAAEDVLEAAVELIAARQRPREGWHNKYRNEANHRYFDALNKYAAILAAQADPYVWQESVNQARRQMQREKL